MSESTENPVRSRSFQSPCGPRPEPNLPTLLPQCNGPWPSCFRRRFDLRRMGTTMISQLAVMEISSCVSPGFFLPNDY